MQRSQMDGLTTMYRDWQKQSEQGETMTKDEALKLALEALKQIDEAMPFPVAKLAQASIKKALAQPEQEFVAWEQFYPDIGKPQIEVLKLALEALEADELDMVDDGSGNMVFRKEQAITAMEKLLAQPEQEPLAWISTGPARMIHWTADKPAYGDDWVPLYTTPPQRTWVGLTEDEAFACKGRDYFETYKAIEAKLKDKNNG